MTDVKDILQASFKDASCISSFVSQIFVRRIQIQTVF